MKFFINIFQELFLGACIQKAAEEDDPQVVSVARRNNGCISQEQNWERTMQKKQLILSLLAGYALSGTAQATLIDRGGGMIYDNFLDITWLQDANYAKTSGINADGLMNWADATNWAASLSYGGYTDWRLPTTPEADPTCEYQASFGHNCTGSEMGHLFYTDLGGTAGSSILVSASIFQNIQPSAYWSESEYAQRPFNAWDFYMFDGTQAASGKTSDRFAWAVRSGNVVVVPEPATLLLVGLGVAGMLLSRRHR